MRQTTCCRSDSHRGGHFSKEWGLRTESQGRECCSMSYLLWNILWIVSSQRKEEQARQWQFSPLPRRGHRAGAPSQCALAQRLSKYAGKEVLRRPVVGSLFPRLSCKARDWKVSRGAASPFKKSPNVLTLNRSSLRNWNNQCKCPSAPEFNPALSKSSYLALKVRHFMSVLRKAHEPLRCSHVLLPTIYHSDHHSFLFTATSRKTSPFHCTPSALAQGAEIKLFSPLLCKPPDLSAEARQPRARPDSE